MHGYKANKVGLADAAGEFDLEERIQGKTTGMQKAGSFFVCKFPGIFY